VFRGSTLARGPVSIANSASPDGQSWEATSPSADIRLTAPAICGVVLSCARWACPERQPGGSNLRRSESPHADVDSQYSRRAYRLRRVSHSRTQCVHLQHASRKAADALLPPKSGFGSQCLRRNRAHSVDDVSALHIMDNVRGATRELARKSSIAVLSPRLDFKTARRIDLRRSSELRKVGVS
jgi:hypothetical protein